MTPSDSEKLEPVAWTNAEGMDKLRRGLPITAWATQHSPNSIALYTRAPYVDREAAEKIARIIDPSAWEYTEDHGRRNAEFIGMTIDRSMEKAYRILAALTTQPVPVDASAAKGEMHLHDVARRLFSVEYPGRDYDGIGYDAKIGWLASAHVEIVQAIHPVPAPDSGSLSPASGWRLVPEEPTRDMLNAAVDVDSFKLGDVSPLGFRISPQMLFERCYAAMLAAAPLPPANSKEPG